MGKTTNGGPVNAINYGAQYAPSGGKYKGGFTFDGTSYISIPNGPFEQSLPAVTGFSISIWIKPFSFCQDDCYIWERVYDNMDLFFNKNGVIYS